MAVPMVLMALLSDHLATREPHGCRHGDRFVFSAPKGGPLDYGHFRQRVWLPATVAAASQGLAFHDLRRANATGMVLDGVDLKTAQTRLGHSDPRLTIAVYAQATTAADKAAAERLGTRFMEFPRPARGLGPADPPISQGHIGPDLHLSWSGRRDLNPRPQRPERCALPSCATSRAQPPYPTASAVRLGSGDTVSGRWASSW